MRPPARAIPIGVILTAALLFVAINVKSQAPSAPVWEYLSVTGSLANGTTITGAFSRSYTSSATICFITTEGCQLEQVTVSVGEHSAGGEALASAIAQVGEQGWELTTSSETENARVMYFRRLKSETK
jgi:hypothetical protein